MDRNAQETADKANNDVALRKESVDRNYAQLEQMLDDKVSLSARRAWIEIAPARSAGRR